MSTAAMSAADGFARLPPELLAAVAAHAGAVDLLSLASACRAARACAEDADVWRALLTRQLRPVLDHFFGGAVPPPADGSWKKHFFYFRWGWKRLAQERTGRLLVQIATQRPSGRGPHDIPPMLEGLWEWAADVAPETYGVYDVTDFVDEHPGAQVLAEAAGLADATEYFDMAAHSDAALRRLETLAVPGCTALRYDRELEALRHRQPVLALAAGVCAVPPLLCALLRCASSTAPGFQSALPAALSGLAVVGAAAFAIWASLHKGAHLK